FVDDEIGRVVSAIDRVAPDALVIYTSDHGDGLGSHGIGNKGPTVVEEIVRIPLIVRWPGRSPAGTVCPHPASHVDIVPTVLETVGVAKPKLIEGRSMAPCLADASVR